MALANLQLRKLDDQRRKVTAELTALQAEITASGKPATEADKESIAGLTQLQADLAARFTRLDDTLTANAAASHSLPQDRDWPGQVGTGALLLGAAPRITGNRGMDWAARKFGLSNRVSAGFGDMGDFLNVIQSGMMDSRLAVLASGQKELGGSTGGFLVPDDLAVEVLGPAYEASVCLQRANVIHMVTDEKKVAGWDTTSASGGTLFGGFTPSIIGEGESMSAQTGQVRSIKLIARKVGLLAKSSNELVDDAGALPELLQSGLSTAVGYTIDHYCLWGTGGAQPLGVMHAPSRITVAKEAAQDAATIWAENVTAMFARLHPACYANSVWLAHPSTIPQLESMTVSVGVGGAVYRVLSDADGQPTILHRPVIFTEKCAVLGAEGDLVLTDLSQYALGMRKEITIEQSRHVFFASDETAWRTIVRFDGMPMWASAYTPRNGPTMSWAVTLAIRA